MRARVSVNGAYINNDEEPRVPSTERFGDADFDERDSFGTMTDDTTARFMSDGM